MTSTHPIYRDGGSNNKPHCFIGKYYDFWKFCMQAYLEAQGDDIWDAVENDPFIPATIINNAEQVKLKGSQNDDDRKKVIFDKKAKNMLQSSFGMDELSYVSQF